MTKQIARAVIVEDSTQMQTMIRMVLGSLGAKDIAMAADGSAALTALQAAKTDVVIMDWKMEGMDGLECTRRIRAGVEGIDPQIPILLLTGNVGKESETAAYSAGASFYMEKPFSLKTLHAGLTKVLIG